MQLLDDIMFVLNRVIRKGAVLGEVTCVHMWQVGVPDWVFTPPHTNP